MNVGLCSKSARERHRDFSVLGDVQFLTLGEIVMRIIGSRLPFAALLLTTLCSWTIAAAQITPSQDAYTNSAAPANNYGAAVTLGVVSSTKSMQNTYIQFDLSSIPAGYTGANIGKASLKLFVNAVTTAGSFNVDYVNGSWTEQKITANAGPALGTTIASGVSLTTANAHDYVLIDVTSALTAWLDGTEPNDGIALVANSPLSATFDSKESTTNSHPAELDVVFTSGSTITGVTTATGSGLTGGGTTGTLNLGLTTDCATNQVLQWNGSAWSCTNLSAGGTITGVTSGTGLTGGGATGIVTLNVDPTQVPFLNAGNTFTGNQTMNGNLSATGVVTGSGFQIGSNIFAFGTYLSGNAFTGFAGSTGTTGVSNTATGVAALSSDTTGRNNTAMGQSALSHNIAGSWNTAIGTLAMYLSTGDATGNGSYNTAVGDEALYANSTGSGNTAVGEVALESNTTGQGNTATGEGALFSNTTGISNTANGNGALYDNTGNVNTASGVGALGTNTAGSYNTALGGFAGQAADGSKTTASNDTFLGAMSAVSTGSLTNATAIGANSEVAASNAMVLGSIAGVNGATANTNVGIGTTTPLYTLDVHGAGNFTGPVTFAAGQTFPGTGSVSSIASGAGLAGGTITSSGTLSIAAAGVTNAMLANPFVTIMPGTGLTGGGIVTLGGTIALNVDSTQAPLLTANNTFTGTQTVNSGDVAITTGNLDLPQTSSVTNGVITLAGAPFISACCSSTSFNTFVGTGAGNFNTQSGYNTAVGYQALTNNTSTTNTAIGTTALKANTSGSSNTAVGTGSLQVNTTGGSNTAVGASALEQNGLGLWNTAVGQGAGVSNTTGNSNTFVGQGADAGSQSLTNATAIGSAAIVSESNALVLGAPGTSVGINTSSPQYSLDVHGTGNFTAPVTFAANQTFPGTVTSVASGAGLTGGPITANGSLSIATGGVTNAMLTNPSVTVTAGTGLVGGGVTVLGGATTLSVDTTKVPQLTANNTFTGNQTVNGNVVLSGASSGIQFPDGTVQTSAATSQSPNIPTGLGLIGTSPIPPPGYSVLATIGTGGNTWAQGSLAPMPTPRNGTAAVSLNGLIYVIGGVLSNGTYVATMEAYNPVTNTWAAEAPMLTPRADLAAVAVNGLIYAIGGGNFTLAPNTFNAVEVYDPASNTWTTKSPMPTARLGLGAAVVNNLIYAVGGDGWCNSSVGNLTTATVEVYDPSADTWSTGQPLTGGQSFTGCNTTPWVTAFAGASAQVVNGLMYAMGGYYDSGLSNGTVEVFDPIANSWSTTAAVRPVKSSGAFISAVVVNGKIYAVESQGATELYDPVANTWTVEATLSQANSGTLPPSAFSANGFLYVVGSSSNVAYTDQYSPPVTLYAYIKN